MYRFALVIPKKTKNNTNTTTKELVESRLGYRGGQTIGRDPMALGIVEGKGVIVSLQKECFLYGGTKS